ncbi:unnamed protein product, partial [Ixodes hexagonus]
IPPDQAATAASATTILCAGALRQRDPKLFTGLGDDDIDDWLESFERVSVHNKWDDPMKLNNVIFYLTDVAKLWYTNHESELATWTQFKTKIQEVFGKPAQRKLIAKRTLASRVQQQDESFVSYIEDVLKLCKRVDVQMAENEKLRNILKGIAEDAFQLLVVKGPATVSEAIDICQNFSELRTLRLPVSRQLQPPVELASFTTTIDGTANNWSDLRCLIQEIVRNEVARQLGKPSTSPEPFISPSVRALIQEQVSATISSPVVPSAMPTQTRPTYAEVVGHNTMPPSAAQQQPHFSTPCWQARMPDMWRTPENRPICFSCGLVGHIARYCRRRNSYSYGPTPQPLHRPTFSGGRRSEYYPPRGYSDDQQVQRQGRSPSPRRRSISPLRPRTTSPSPEGNC